MQLAHDEKCTTIRSGGDAGLAVLSGRQSCLNPPVDRGENFQYRDREEDYRRGEPASETSKALSGSVEPCEEFVWQSPRQERWQTITGAQHRGGTGRCLTTTGWQQN